jgi:spermidine synthase
MNIWQKYLSYLIEIPIENISSTYTKNLNITLYKGRYALNTTNAVYSWEDLYQNFYKAFEHIEIEKKGYRTCLVVGLGLGSIPFMLEKKFNCKFDFTAVEIDEAIVNVAQKYTLSRLDSTIEIRCTDAEYYINTCNKKFDLIAFDVFIDDKVPEKFESEAFLTTLKNCLQPGGLLLFNRLSAVDENIHSANSFYNKVFKTIFPSATYLDTGGNFMLITNP